MQTVADRPEAPTAIRTDLGAIFVSLELSRSTWLITSLSPGGGEKMSKQVVRGGDVATGTLCATSRESAGEDGEGLPVRRHSGGWPRRILDRSRAAELAESSFGWLYYLSPDEQLNRMVTSSGMPLWTQPAKPQNALEVREQHLRWT